MAGRVSGVALAHVARPGESFEEAVTGIRLLWIPGGEFWMGADDTSPRERPVHRVRVSPFWLGETPVTNAQYEVFVREAGYQQPESWRDSRYSGRAQPMVGVSWDDAMAFCAWLSERSGVNVRLPTEAEWEFAARGTDGRLYPWGNEEPDETRANYAPAFQPNVGQPTPVGSYPAGRGPFGTLDQAGNVFEWCYDIYNGGVYGSRTGTVVDPAGPEGAQTRAIARAIRGGSWSVVADFLHAAYRHRIEPEYRGGNLGFRVCARPGSLEP